MTLQHVRSAMQTPASWGSSKSRVMGWLMSELLVLSIQTPAFSMQQQVGPLDFSFISSETASLSHHPACTELAESCHTLQHKAPPARRGS